MNRLVAVAIIFSKILPSVKVYLKFDLGLTLGKIQRMILGQYDLSISAGVLSEMITRCGQQFKSEYNEMKKNNRNFTSYASDHLKSWNIIDTKIEG